MLRDPEVWNRLVVTTEQALLSTLLTAAIGLPAAYVLSQIRFPGHRIVRFVATVPLVLPTIVVALAFRQLLGDDGWLSAANEGIGTLGAILAAHAFFGVAIFVRVVAPAWSRLDVHAEEAARVLGASRRSAFRHVTLPLLLPACHRAAALVFAFAFTSFAVVLVLGTPRIDTIEVAIYRLVLDGGALPYAATLSEAQLVVTMLALGWGDALPRRAPDRRAVNRRRPLRDASSGERLVVLLVTIAIIALIVLPIAALVNETFALVGARAALSDDGGASRIAAARAVGWSLAFALQTMVIALVVGGLGGIALARVRESAVRTALALPIAVPAVMLAVAYLITFNSSGYDLRGTPLLVLIAHSVLAYPFVVRPVAYAARAIDPRLAEAAMVLGASPRRAWWQIEFRLMPRALVVGALFAFVVSLGEVGATLLLHGAAFTTAPVAIADALTSGGAQPPEEAYVLATFLLAVTVVAFVIIERVRSRDAAEF